VAEWWEQHGYYAGRELDDGLWLCAAPMLFTTRLMICTPDSVHEFWCYPDRATALAAFEVFDGHGDPLDGWVKHHPSMRRRPAPA
jgi:hypothetical protein